ncbi:sulfotransferase [Paraglaciecola aestuariivivens]
MNDVNTLLKNLVSAVKLGDAKQSANCLQLLIELKPKLLQNWLGVAKMGILSGHISYAKQALAMLENQPELALADKLQHCAMLIEVGQINLAYEHALALEKTMPNSPEVCHLLSTVALQLGFAEQAKSYANKVLQQWPMSGQALLILASAQKIKPNDEIFAQLQGAEGAVTATNNPQSIASFYAALSKVYVDINDHEKAFEFAKKSNAPMVKVANYQAQEDQQNLRFIASQFNAQSPQTHAIKAASKTNPIFIVGLPRSGTSLLEQMICSHSEVLDGGEFNGMERAARVLTKGLPIGSSAEHFDEHKLNNNVEAIRNAYLQYAHQRFGSDGIIVDKSLSNNRYLWLIKKVFPQSPIIYIKRDPLDSAWSCYRTHFSSGLGWSTNLTQMGIYFGLEEKLSNLWLELYPSSIFSLNYEELVAHPQQQISELLRFCGLNFEAEILNFYKNTRPVYTASVTQVRESIHQQAVGPSLKVKHLLTPFLDEYQKIKNEQS